MRLIPTKQTLLKWSIVLANSLPLPVMAAELEEIVVTAQKREQSIQDVGITMAAFSSSDIEHLGFDDPRDLMFQVPGLVVSYSQGSNIPNFALRGVGLNDFAPNNSSPVAVHLDEVYQSYSALLNFGLYDIDRIEVLKGPQGTLFGRNTTGGAVNIFTRKPTDQFDAGVGAKYGNYDAASVDFHVNGALGEKVAGRLAGFYKTQGSGPWRSRFHDRDLGDVDSWWGMRGQLLFTPTDEIDINVNVHGGKEDSESAQYNMLPALNATGTGPCPAYVDGSLQGGEPDCFDLRGNQEPDSDPFTNSAGLVNTQKLENIGTSIAVNWDLGFATLTSISGYDNLKRFAAEDADGFPQIIVDDLYKNEIDQYSEELRLTSNAESSLRWILGAYASHDEIDTPRQEFLGTDFPVPGGLNAIYEQNTDTVAVFAHTELDLSEHWRVIGGLRYTDEERSFDGRTIATNTSSEIGAPGISYDPEIVLASLDDEISFSDVSWKAGVDYLPGEDALLYVSVSKGFKSGGFNGNLAFSDAELQPFDEETLIAYEAGAKLSLLDNAMQWNTAVFFYDYQDVILQIGETVPLPGGGGTFTVFRLNNGADADVAGVESDLAWSPIDGLDLKAGVAYIDTELKNAAPGNQALNGSQLNYTPDWSGNWLVRYATKVSDGLVWTAQIDGTYKGDFYAEVPNTPVAKVDSYILWNASTGIESANGRWTATLWAQNLGDEEYTQYVNDLIALGTVLRSTGYPRTYGLSVSMTW